MGASISSYTGNGPTQNDAMLALCYNIINDGRRSVSRCGWYNHKQDESREFYPAIYVEGYGWFFVDFEQINDGGVRASFIFRASDDKRAFKVGEQYDFDRLRWLSVGPSVDVVKTDEL